jgi:hypothetical protein
LFAKGMPFSTPNHAFCHAFPDLKGYKDRYEDAGRVDKLGRMESPVENE